MVPKHLIKIINTFLLNEKILYAFRTDFPLRFLQSSLSLSTLSFAFTIHEFYTVITMFGEEFDKLRQGN